MKYSLRIFLSIVLVVGLGFWGFGYWLMKEVRSQYAVTIEDSLVDFSNLLASYLASQAKGGQLNTKDMESAFQKFKNLNYRATIHGVEKQNSPVNAYVTDAKGIVVYDSRDPNNIGKDFSAWNDVHKTLRGEYGARSTRTDSSDPLSSVFYVGAPILDDYKIIGVVSVIKAEQSLGQFFEKGMSKIILISILVLLGAVLIAAVFSFWLTRPINKLIDYAKRVTQGESSRPPKTFTREFNNLGQAFDEMRISLEGKKSVENFVQHLTHELKSPLTAIQGAAELLEDELPEDKKKMFLDNIASESQRSRKLLEELLTVAALESRSGLEKVQSFSLKSLLDEIKTSVSSILEKKKIDLQTHLEPSDIQINGERLLIERAISNLILNAIEFSPESGIILVEGKKVKDKIHIHVRDQGPGIPEYARTKIFEKFFSLERPSTGKKSSGLGLSFVREAISLHSGTVLLESPQDPMGGANFLILLDN